MYSQDMMSLLVQILLIAGALNWGLVAIYNLDAVNMVAGAALGSYIKMAVGAAGIYAVYMLVMSFYPTAEKAPEEVPVAEVPVTEEQAQQA